MPATRIVIRDVESTGKSHGDRLPLPAIRQIAKACQQAEKGWKLLYSKDFYGKICVYFGTQGIDVVKIILAIVKYEEMEPVFRIMGRFGPNRQYCCCKVILFVSSCEAIRRLSVAWYANRIIGYITQTPDKVLNIVK